MKRLNIFVDETGEFGFGNGASRLCGVSFIFHEQEVYSIYQFSRRIPVKYKTIIIDKKYIDNGRILRQKLSLEINKMVKENYLIKFNKIV